LIIRIGKESENKWTFSFYFELLQNFNVALTNIYSKNSWDWNVPYNLWNPFMVKEKKELPGKKKALK